jgi:hypothetical protein
MCGGRAVATAMLLARVEGLPEPSTRPRSQRQESRKARTTQPTIQIITPATPAKDATNSPVATPFRRLNEPGTSAAGSCSCVETTNAVMKSGGHSNIHASVGRRTDFARLIWAARSRSVSGRTISKGVASDLGSGSAEASDRFQPSPEWCISFGSRRPHSACTSQLYAAGSPRYKEARHVSRLSERRTKQLGRLTCAKRPGSAGVRERHRRQAAHG